MRNRILKELVVVLVFEVDEPEVYFGLEFQDLHLVIEQPWQIFYSLVKAIFP